MSLSINDLVTAFFLIILVKFSNFLSSFFPRQLYYFFTNNQLVKHLLFFFLVYFAKELVNNSESSPLENFYNSLVLYAFYLLFVKSTLIFSLIILLLLAVNFVMAKEQEYLKKNNQEYKQLDKPIEIMSYVILGFLILSFFYYLNKQITEHKDFNLYKFIVGDLLPIKENH